MFNTEHNLTKYSFFLLMSLQAENMIAHKDEIYSRPKRTWFMTEKEKKLVAKAAKVSMHLL